MTAGYEAGETVTVTITGAKVVTHDDHGLSVTVPAVGWYSTLPPGLPGVIVRREAPADGLPARGEVWADAAGNAYFAVERRGGRINLVDTYGGAADWEDVHGGDQGPIRRVAQAGWAGQDEEAN
jgi:hypothetical protein